MIYILHFDRPYQHARHYIGFTESDDVMDRVREHGTVNGSRLLQVVKAAGIGWTVSRILAGDRKRERQIKQNRGGRYCPLCQQERLAQRAGKPSSPAPGKSEHEETAPPAGPGWLRSDPQ